MEQARILRVVVASPGDVQAERDLLPAVIDEINRGVAEDRGVQLRLYRWETDAHPGFHPEGPQGLIDPILKIADCDLLIGIFWKRFGTPVKDADSGTEHEFRVAYKAWKETGRPQIFVYFNHQPYAPQSSREAEQWLKVLAFKESFPTEGLWWSYEGKDDFKDKVRVHLTNFIRRLPQPGRKPKPNSKRNAAAPGGKKKAAREPEELIAAYRARLAERVSRVRLLGEDESRPLEKVFVKLTITDYERPPRNAEFLRLMDAAMRRRQRVFVREDESDGPGGGGEREVKIKRTLSPDELLRGHTKAVITGAPGAGKTTLARWLAAQWLKEPDHLPAFLELKTVSAKAFDEADGDLAELLFQREFAQPLELEPAERLRLRAVFRERLQKGAATVILDGLDEVSGSDYFQRLGAAVNHFNATYRQCRLLITTRPYALRAHFDNLKEVEIAPLNDRQIAEFLAHYFGDAELWRRFRDELQRRRELREMARVPTLLGFIVQFWRERGAISDNRLELYRQIVQLLAARLDEEKNIERKFQVIDPDGALKRDFLRHLAFARLFDDRVQRDAERLVFTGEQLREEADRFRRARELELNPYHLAADVKKTPLLREVGDDVWAFLHLTLQEYLAATALAKRDDCLRVFCRAYFNPALAEMELLPMTLGLVSKQERFYEVLEQLPESLDFKGLRVRARGLAYAKQVESEHLDDLANQLLTLIRSDDNADTAYRNFVAHSFSGATAQAEKIIVGAVASLLQDPKLFEDWDVVWILEHIGGEEALRILRSTLCSDRNNLDWIIASALGNIGDAASVDILLKKLDSEKSTTRGFVAEALGKIGEVRASENLLGLLRDPEQFVRWYAAEAIGKLGDREIVKTLRTMTTEEASIRGPVSLALWLLGEKQAFTLLLKLSEEQDKELREKAALIMSEIGDDRAIEPLLKMLRDPVRQVRFAAAHALAVIASEESIPGLIEALSSDEGDQDKDVRWRAADVLGAIGGEAATKALIEALEKNDAVSARWHAAKALGEIGGEAAIAALNNARLNEANEDVRRSVALALGKNYDPTVLDDCLAALNVEKDYPYWVIEALRRIGDERAVESLLEVLSGEDPFLSKKAAEALQSLSSELLAKGLLKALRNGSSPIRKKAAEVVGYYVD